MSKILTSKNDKHADYLSNKLKAGTGITLSIDSSSDHERVQIENSSSGFSNITITPPAGTSPVLPDLGTLSLTSDDGSLLMTGDSGDDSIDFSVIGSSIPIGTFTTGSILFAGATDIAEDNANLFWDDTLNKLSCAKLDAGGTNGQHPLQANGGIGGLAATSGSTVGGGIVRFVNATNIALDFGTLNVSPWPAWLQAHDSTSQGSIYALSLQPQGGVTGIGTTVPVGKLHVDQPSTSGAIPVLTLDQGDIDDTFINFIGTSAADGTRSISSDTTEDSAKFGAIRVEINGTTKWIRIYDNES